MVTVVMMSALIFAMIAGLAIRSVRDIEDAGDERVRERALHVGESGIEDVLNRVVVNKTYNTTEVLPAASTTWSVTDERAWAKSIADALPNGSPRLVPTGGGEWVSIKPLPPSGTGVAEVAYAVGYVPSRVAAQNVRVIRISYDFAPLAPTAAFLTDGDLEINGGPALSGLVGSAHANGDVDIDGNSVTTSGFIAGSGTFDPATPPSGIGDPANSGGGRPSRMVPPVVPGDFHELSQYDLCGTVIKEGPATTGTSHLPCAGAVVAQFTGINAVTSFRGWERHATGEWRYTSATNYDGVYYVDRQSVQINGGGSDADPLNITLIVDCAIDETVTHSAHSTKCDISVGGNPVLAPYPTTSGLLFVSGRDIDMNGTSGTRLSGATLAHEQIQLRGNTGYTGTMISNSPFHTNGSPVSANLLGGNATITYSGGARINLGDNIRITHWQEL